MHEMRISIRRGTEKIRNYTVILETESQERLKAKAELEVNWHEMIPDIKLPEFIWNVGQTDGQKYLSDHPFPCRYSMIHQRGKMVTDYHIKLLSLFPEVENLVISSDNVSDQGISSLVGLSGLKDLCLYSERLTDDCLCVLEKFALLESLDLQGSTNISADRAKALSKKLSKLKDYYPPSTRHA